MDGLSFGANEKTGTGTLFDDEPSFEPVAGAGLYHIFTCLAL